MVKVGRPKLDLPPATCLHGERPPPWVWRRVPPRDRRCCASALEPGHVAADETGNASGNVPRMCEEVKPEMGQEMSQEISLEMRRGGSRAWATK